MGCYFLDAEQRDYSLLYGSVGGLEGRVASACQTLIEEIESVRFTCFIVILIF